MAIASLNVMFISSNATRTGIWYVLSLTLRLRLLTPLTGSLRRTADFAIDNVHHLRSGRL